MITVYVSVSLNKFFKKNYFDNALCYNLTDSHFLYVILKMMHLIINGILDCEIE